MATTHHEALSFRSMRPTERAAVQRLGAQVFAPFGDYDAALHTWLRSPGVISSVAAHPEEGLVGFTLLGLIATPEGDTQAYLLGIGVDADWRRRGLGGRLLDDALAHARRNQERWGVSDVWLEVANDNRSARELFVNAGFVPLEGASRSYAGGQSSQTMRAPLA